MQQMRVLLRRALRRTYSSVLQIFPLRWLWTRFNLLRNQGKESRRLEIGPGNQRILGFETLNIVADINVDYIHDATKTLPFLDESFELIYSSHILEHVPWYMLGETLREWVRILRPGGQLEVWVPNGLEICRVFVEYETTGVDRTALDGWYRFNPERDPCLWAAGRVFTYGDGRGTPSHPNWHRALFSPRFLKKLFEQSGLVDIQQLDNTDVRGYDHGWINLGFRGIKP